MTKRLHNPDAAVFRGAREFWRAGMLALSLGAITLLAVGCAAPAADEPRHERLDEVFEIPALLEEPLSVLLTNVDGFSAHVEVHEQGRIRTGQVLGHGTHLLFAPERAGGLLSRRKPGEQTFFIWDAAQGNGFVINEALQGYAPISTKTKVVSLAYNDIGSVFDTLEGHRCRRMEAVVNLGEGPAAEFSVWRASELNDFPVQIKSKTSVLTIKFSKIQFEKPSPAVFTPPEGFTRHAGPEVMLGTLLERQVRMKTKPVSEWDASHPNAPASPGHIGGGMR